MLNPAIVQAMTAEALCESLIRVKAEGLKEAQRADALQAEVERLKQENEELKAAKRDS
jgi:hypothetical protein